MKQNKSTSRWQSLRLPCLLAASLASLTASYADTYSDAVKADGPTAYYRMEDGAGATTITDEMGGNPGEWMYDTDDSGNPAYPKLMQPGLQSNASVLHPYTDGAGTFHSAYGTIPWSEAINPSSSYTVEVWVRPTTGSKTYHTPMASVGNDINTGWLIGQTDSTWIWCLKYGIVWMEGGTVDLLHWHHLVATYDGSKVLFFVNGQQVSSWTMSDYTGNDGADMVIGGITSGSLNYDGSIDEIALYDKALSLDRIQAHYEIGTNSIRVADSAPAVLTPPSDTTVYAGRVASFSVGTDGTPPLSYQWYKGNTAITDATNKDYSFTCMVADNGTTYKVVITNALGSTTSTAATLTVSTDLLLLGNPVSVTRYTDSKAGFFAEAGGALPFTYQWYKGSTPIPNATNSMLWVDKVTSADSGSTYYATFGNGFHTTNTEPATLTVISRPVSVDVSKGNAKIVMADDPVAYWRLDEASGSTTVIDAAGSFDGTYNDNNGAGIFSYEVPSGITNETDTALGVSQKAQVNVPWAPEINPHGAFSVEAWLKPASLANDYVTAFSSESDSSDEFNPTGWLIYQSPGNQWAWILFQNNWEGTTWLAATNSTIVAGQWYHLVMTFDGSLASIYVNGELGGATSAANYHPARTGGLSLGHQSLNLTLPFDGVIDEVAIYNKALPAAKVKAHYTQSTVVTAPSNISIARSGTSVTLTWTSGVLQECATVNGTYTDVAGAASPYTATANTGTKFYRLKGQ